MAENMAAVPQQSEDFTNDLDDLSIFTNARWFDYDMGEQQQQPPNPSSFPQDTAGSVGPSPIDFLTDFNFPDLNGLPSNGPPAILSDSALPEQDFGGLSYPGSNFSTPPNGPSIPNLNSNSNASRGAKRNRTDSIAEDDTNPADASLVAAEEDKRRRNTAASARFRVKKKQREQAMERKATDMEKKVESLKTKVRELERDNKLLKNLLTERGDNYDLNELKKKDGGVPPNKQAAVKTELQ